MGRSESSCIRARVRLPLRINFVICNSLVFEITGQINLGRWNLSVPKRPCIWTMTSHVRFYVVRFCPYVFIKQWRLLPSACRIWGYKYYYYECFSRTFQVFIVFMQLFLKNSSFLRIIQNFTWSAIFIIFEYNVLEKLRNSFSQLLL